MAEIMWPDLWLRISFWKWMGISAPARTGDATAERIFERCVKVWRTGILNLIHAYDPAVVILSGAVMQFEGLFERLEKGLQEQIWDCCGKVEIRKASYIEDSVLYGLCYGAEEAWGENA